MSDAWLAPVRRCPAWCSVHYEPTQTDDPDIGHMCEGMKSTRALSIWGNSPITTSLTRCESLAGDPESYCIELQSENGILLSLTPADAEYLTDRLRPPIHEIHREPAVQQTRSTD